MKSLITLAKKATAIVLAVIMTAGCVAIAATADTNAAGELLSLEDFSVKITPKLVYRGTTGFDHWGKDTSGFNTSKAGSGSESVYYAFLKAELAYDLPDGITPVFNWKWRKNSDYSYMGSFDSSDESVSVTSVQSESGYRWYSMLGDWNITGDYYDANNDGQITGISLNKDMEMVPYARLNEDYRFYCEVSFQISPYVHFSNPIEQFIRGLQIHSEEVSFTNTGSGYDYSPTPIDYSTAPKTSCVQTFSFGGKRTGTTDSNYAYVNIAPNILNYNVCFDYAWKHGTDSDGYVTCNCGVNEESNETGFFTSRTNCNYAGEQMTITVNGQSVTSSATLLSPFFGSKEKNLFNGDDGTNITVYITKYNIFEDAAWAYSDYPEPSSTTAGPVGSGCDYEFDWTDSIPAHAFDGYDNLESVVIPEGITEIGDSAFSGCSGLTEIIIPDGVTTIGDDVFAGCEGLTSITIPESVTNIGENAFRGCTGLESITVDVNNTVYHSSGNCLIETDSGTLIAGCKNSVIPDDGSVTAIGDGAFYACTEIEEIAIPGSVTVIGDYAFYRCYGLEDVTISNGVTSIGESAFAECSGLKTITIPDSVTSIGEMAFDNCPLEYVEMGDGLTEIPPTLIKKNSIKTFIIGDGVESVADEAFSGCSALESITIGEGVKQIGNSAFASCPKLSVIYFNAVNADDLADYTPVDPDDPDSNMLVNIRRAFCWSGSESGISVVFGDNVERIPAYLFATQTSLDPGNVYYNPIMTSLTFGSNVKEIGRGAFLGANVRASVSIPDSVTDIDDFAFGTCLDMTNLSLGAGVKNIGRGAFAYCRITDLELPDSLETIGDRAFFNARITKLEIPAGVRVIEGAPFSACFKIETITADSENTVYHSAGNCLIETESKTLICGCKNSVIPDDGTVTSIGERAFWVSADLESISIPEGVTEIGACAFAATGLKQVYIPKSVSVIRGAAFESAEYMDLPVLEDVYYGGSEEEWKNITFETQYEIDGEEFNEPNCHDNIFNADIHYNCDGIHVHSYSEETTKEPTCLETGLKILTCSCGDSYEAEIPALGHDIISHEGEEASCGKAGYKPYDTCSRCDYTTYEEIPATGNHIWQYSTDKYTITVHCTNCDESFSLTAVLPENLKCSDEAKEITITGEKPDGFVASISYDTDDGLAPKTAGTYTAHFDLRPDDLSDVILARIDIELVIEHDIVLHDGQAETCEDDGWEPYETCSYCDYTTYSVIPAKKHNYVASYFWSDDGKTCTATATCANNPEHKFSEEATITSAVKEDSTCTEYGTTTYTATFENKLFAEQTKDVADIEPKQHNYVASYFWSDDGKSCTATATCTNDPEHTFAEEATISSAVKVKPTCEEKGTTTYTASFNNKFFAAQTKDVVDIPANGHTEIIKNAVDPTCTTPGYTGTVFCSVCNQPLRNGEERPALGHSFTNYIYNNDATYDRDGTETAKCNRCNETDTRTKAGTKLTPETPVNPTANARINVAGTKSVDYRTKVTIKATATNLDPAYHLVLVINGKEVEGNNKEVSYDYGEIKSDINYFVKIVDAGGTIQRDANGAELKKDGGKITCNAGFFQKLAAFFKGLFGALPSTTVKP